MRSVIIFQEQNFLFGLDLSQFKSHFLLEQIWIKPSEKSSQQWEYHNKEKNTSGQFIHFGRVLGIYPTFFSHEGSVFLKNVGEENTCGIYVNNFIAQIPYEKADSSFYKLGPGVNLPENTPWEFFQNAFKYKRRTVLLINPDQILKHYLGDEAPQSAPALTED